MKLFLCFTLCLMICYIHLSSSESSTTHKPTAKSTKTKDKASAQSTSSNTAKAKEKNKKFTKNTDDGTKTKGKNKMPMKDTDGPTRTKDKSKINKKNVNDRDSATKTKKALNIRTPFDKVLDKLSNCAASSTASPSLVEVMQENLKELQSDEKYTSLFNAAPHTAAFLKKKKQDSRKFVDGLRQALGADWSHPAWKSADEIDTLFRPFKQQFVYTMMRFNCT